MGRVYDENGNVEQTNNYFAYGGLTNDVTAGTDTQTRKFGGKELDRMHGLDLSDFSARQYDAAIGQFTSMDPLCEKYYHISPYAYCAGNPVRFVDPDGRFIAIYDGDIQYRYDINDWVFKDADNNPYCGNDSFIADITECIQAIMGGEFGSSFITELSMRNEGIAIVPFEKCMSRPRNGYKKDASILSIVGMDLDQQVEGGTTYTNLVHELAHSQDQLNGTMNNEVWTSINGKDLTKSEIYATHVENMVRAEHIPVTSIRQYYSGNDGKIVEFKNNEFRSLYFFTPNEYVGTCGKLNTYKNIKTHTGYVYKSYR